LATLQTPDTFVDLLYRHFDKKVEVSRERNRQRNEEETVEAERAVEATERLRASESEAGNERETKTTDDQRGPDNVDHPQSTPFSFNSMARKE
jgi:hypothetical protein